jgi:RNA polymerase sigma-70 factor (ECF subfamily)
MEEDLKTIESVWSGDKEAFGRLYEKYAKKIYDFVFFRVSSKETAEDLTSDVFFKALSGLWERKFSGGNFSAWLYRIARNRIIDHYRTAKVESPLQEDSRSDEGAFERQAEARGRLREVADHLGSLKPEQREIVVMRVWDELSYKEIAAITGKSEAAAKMVFARALSALKRSIPPEALLLIVIMNSIKI